MLASDLRFEREKLAILVERKPRTNKTVAAMRRATNSSLRSPIHSTGRLSRRAAHSTSTHSG